MLIADVGEFGLVLEGDSAFFDADRAIADLQKIVVTAGAIMGNRYDYPYYYFLHLVTEAGGGLEHKNSFLTMSSRFTTRTPCADARRSISACGP